MIAITTKSSIKVNAAAFLIPSPNFIRADCIVFICESSYLAVQWQARQQRISKTSLPAGKKLSLFSTGHPFNILAHYEDIVNLHETRRPVNTLFETYLQPLREPRKGDEFSLRPG